MLPRKEKIITPDETHHVEPKVMDVLVCLATRAGEVVTRDELLREVWSDTIVGDEVLSRAISLLRSCLGDERTNPKFIRTIPRQGYELIADIVPVEAAQAATRNTWQKAIFAMVGGIALAGIYLAWQPPEPGRISLAVLPLTDTLWPDFRARHLQEAILAYQKRDSRYGGIHPEPAIAGR